MTVADPHTGVEWLGLERVGESRWGFTLTDELSRPDARFYGGTGLAVVTAAIELETQRRALWATAQFVSSAATGDRFECQVEVLAAGRRSSQVRVTGRVDGRLVFSGLGAAGEARTGPLEAQFGQMPVVPPPLECPRWAPPRAFARRGERPGWLSITDARAAGEGGAMWMHLEGRPLTRAALAFLSDTLPSAVVRASGRDGAGTSLDNTVRFGPEPEGDWMLVDVDPHMIASGYLHGAARLWSERGRLLGIASQTASVMLFE
ncbi:thioesterase family protein [Acidiferrimicrobium sp. IK]|uniref:thioesterase family protein n=1 Tax=Acidiferrimicrobium sp. IK TaxID=2871700 RepID=UPI0021CB4F4E|nr:thioesterase family protein [Acidiferrimicrobium sp. IK]MCU4186710.1 thioesterase family protein [Acidiferrimicrobium sp. IK]